jgi:hypothetical protein
MSEAIKQFLQQAKGDKDKTHLSLVAMYDNRKVITLEDGRLNFIERYSRKEGFSTDPVLINEFNSLFSNTDERVKLVIAIIEDEVFIDPIIDGESFYNDGLRDAISIIKKHFGIKE